MTLFLADIASYQGALTLGQVKDAGFSIVNVKTSHGLGQKSVHHAARDWISGARSVGLGVSTFHWLDASAPGRDQAAYAYSKLVELGALTGPCAHVVDCESDATEEIYRGYVATMTSLLGRPIVTYTGDWWWQPRGWAGAVVSPWLHAAPNDGSMIYPGDQSDHWRAGYGGWPELAIMQYRVAPVAGINVSQSAVRSADLWRAMTGDTVAKSQNGWPVVGPDQIVDKPLAGVEFPNGWLAGDVDVVFTYLIGRLHREVEPMVPGWCWGWYVKTIEGSTAISNHASGTAFDYNAPRHPLGVAGTWTAEERATVHAILDDLDGIVRWGEDYSGRKDGMHFEINKDPAAVKRVADKIRGQDVELTDKIGDKTYPHRTVGDLFRDLMNLRDLLLGEPKAKDVRPAYPGGILALAQAAGTDYPRLKAEISGLTSSAKGATEILKVLRQTEAVDVGALAVQLAPILASAVIAGLPDDRDDLTPDELKGAIVGALSELVNRAPAEDDTTIIR